MDWEKTRIQVAPLGGYFKLPWDNATSAHKPKYTPKQRAAVGLKLGEIFNSKN